MSRGPGRHQRLLLDALAASPMVSLRGRNRSETAAIVRAARTLERAGRCVLVQLWNDDHTAAPLACFRPGYRLKAGRPVESVSVARVPPGTGATLNGSHRDVARRLGTSKSTVGRDVARATK